MIISSYFEAICAFFKSSKHIHRNALEEKTKDARCWNSSHAGLPISCQWRDLRKNYLTRYRCILISTDFWRACHVIFNFYFFHRLIRHIGGLAVFRCLIKCGQWFKLRGGKCHSAKHIISHMGGLARHLLLCKYLPLKLDALKWVFNVNSRTNL